MVAVTIADAESVFEHCCVCRAPTKFWYGHGPLNVALCCQCANHIDDHRDLPTKRAWLARERVLRNREEKGGIGDSDKILSLQTEITRLKHQVNELKEFERKYEAIRSAFINLGILLRL